MIKYDEIDTKDKRGNWARLGKYSAIAIDPTNPDDGSYTYSKAFELKMSD